WSDNRARVRDRARSHAARCHRSRRARTRSREVTAIAARRDLRRGACTPCRPSSSCWSAAAAERSPRCAEVAPSSSLLKFYGTFGELETFLAPFGVHCAHAYGTSLFDGGNHCFVRHRG